MTGRLSRNCEQALEEGIPLDHHITCTGCPGCECHHVRPVPGGLHAAYRAAKAGEDPIVPVQREGRED